MIVHFDCNNFFASCELVGRPELAGRPVVVANSNEAGGGVVLALNAEAKALGLKRGQPLFRVRQLLEGARVAVLRADHAKYSAISKRLMARVQRMDLLLHFIPYSIDEFFGELPLDEPDEALPYARRIRLLVAEEEGIGMSCGISTTYTLAKAATWFAKRYAAYEGVCPLPESKREAALERLPATEVWGLGRRSADKLARLGIKSALDFAQHTEGFVRRWFTVGGVNTWHELRGERCISLARPGHQKSIMRSRSFARHVEDFEALRQHLANHVAAAARRLREQHCVCATVSVRLRTNPYRTDLPQYVNQASVSLPMATADTMLLLRTATEALRQIFRPNYLYKKLGVTLTDIRSDAAVEQDLFATPSLAPERSRRLMSAIDALNARFGAGKIQLATQAAETAAEAEADIRTDEADWPDD